ncbi:hypothetical protein Q4R52_19040, partial [Morganella morganii]
MRRVLIVKTSSMGDVLHTLPALTDAVQVFPALTFDWVVEEGFACDALDIGGLAEAVSQLPCDHLSSRMSECARQRVLP